ncbi:DUF3592 domain-containing protein [Chitinophaga sp.]|uniref:DUF3592 domain-containing protein n=1 Tax=Chitinophaga sp. TaxID=1869181 RepID=UPI002F95CB6D
MKHRIITLTFSIFLAVGLLLTGISLLLWYNTASYNAASTKTTGTVVDLLEKGNHAFSPVVMYADANGTKHRYISDISSRPAGYSIGETIEMYYETKNPDNARIADWSQYLGCWITGGLGIIFSILGLGYFVKRKASHSRQKQLKQSGLLVHANIVSVENNPSIEVNGRNPFFIRCEAKDSLTGNKKSFKSGLIWSDPRPAIGNHKKINVYVDRNNSRKYYVDISPFEEE